MINILIWLAIIVLAIFVITFLAKATLLTIAGVIAFKQEYEKQKQLKKWRGK